MKTALTSFVSFLLLVGFVGGDVIPIGAGKAAAKLKKDPKIVVVDLRTPKEFFAGHIKGAININMNDKNFAAKLGKLDRKKTYLMHCRSGGRSSASLQVWKRLGFEKVLHLASGTLGWEKGGQQLEVPKGPAKTK
ncbi:MAG: rhodanese-related sulfurtransferase [Akkermansiaceae bacterium]|jgi:phage shock protein E|nr:rhodanese-like domain protein [uncultured bacterium]|tara:strand:+ start:1189 stop:1593 length:405 start_codon:yes stop_codon:yes gene_type:complete